MYNLPHQYRRGLFLEFHFFGVGADLLFGGFFYCVGVDFSGTVIVGVYTKGNGRNLVFGYKDVGFSYGETSTFFVSGNCVICCSDFVFGCCRLDIDSCIGAAGYFIFVNL